MRLALSAITLLLSIAAAAPAAADAPLPRGPQGGCGQGFQLLTIAAADEIDPAAGVVARKDDVNQDGLICLRFGPKGGGTIVDNKAVGRG
ncbi:MAG: hypothetical protein AVDCRST_MAG36-173 [uncultured Nocardioidaceae bacterium]|uniref:Uncharacterized protein n=1 Tax=uncultured Nocardioidaceae bacterium TaxID=253824 RepID=A0A6J4KVP5_9ACTN|nr:MAG: hypothetical protein AVDCRST_MAG36-173 [uncultured Nocardioidaceae bacterium]